MPVSWSVHTSGRFAVLTIEDPHTFEEWRSTVLAMVAATSASPQMCLLVDRRHSTPPSSEQVKQMIDFFEQNRSVLARRSAAIVVVDDAGFGVARMIELRSRLELPDGTIRVFRQYDEAVKWLTDKSAV